MISAIGMIVSLCLLYLSIKLGEKTMRYMETRSFWVYFASIVCMYFSFFMLFWSYT